MSSEIATTILNNGIRNDNKVINDIFKNSPPASAEDLMTKIEEDNQFLSNIVKYNKFDFNNNNVKKNILDTIKKTYKHLKDSKQKFSDVNDQSLYVFEEEMDKEVELLMKLFEKNKINNAQMLLDLIDDVDEEDYPKNRKSVLKKKINLFTNECNNSVNSKTKNTLMKFVQKEYKLYALDGINKNKIKKLMLEYLNTDFNVLAKRFKALTQKDQFTKEERIKAFLSTTALPSDKSLKDMRKANNDFKDLKTSIAKELKRSKPKTGVSLKEFLTNDVKLSSEQVKLYFQFERVLNPKLSKRTEVVMSDKELMDKLNLSESEMNTYNCYSNFLKNREDKKRAKFDKQQENLKRKAEEEDKDFEPSEYKTKYDNSAQTVLKHMLIYEKFIFDDKACDLLANFTNYAIYNLLKYSLIDLVESNNKLTKPKKIVTLSNLKDGDDNLFSLFYKNTSTHTKIIEREVELSSSTLKSTKDSNDSEKTEEEESQVNNESSNVSKPHIKDLINDSPEELKRFKTVISHIKELINCDKDFADYKFNKQYIQVCSLIMDDVTHKLAECYAASKKLKSPLNPDFDDTKLVQKKINLDFVKNVFNTILITLNVTDESRDEFYNILSTPFIDFVRSDITL